MNSIIANIWNHPKTSFAGILISVGTVTGILSQQGITLGKAGTGTVVALIGAIAAGFLGLLSRDPGSSSSSSSSSSSAAAAGKVVSMMVLAACCFMLAGCPASTAVHKASVAAAGVGDGLSQVATLNHQLIQSGDVTAAEGAEVASLVDQAALANDAFVRTLQSIPDTGSTISTQQALVAFSTLQTQVANLNQEGVLHLKSAAAQAKFATVMTAIQGSITAIEVITAVVNSAPAAPAPQSNKLPLAPLGIPALAFAALVLTPVELDELISLALAAGSDLVAKLMSLKGQTDPQLQSSALASDQAAEQQAQADEAPTTGS